MPRPSGTWATPARARRGGHARQIGPAELAGMVFEAIRERRFFLLTHPDEAFTAGERRLEWMRTRMASGERSPGNAAAAGGPR